MDNFKLRHKFIALYIFSILVPVILVDLCFITFVRWKGGKERGKALEFCLERVEGNILNMLDNTIQISDLISDSEVIHQFFRYQFSSEEDDTGVYDNYKKVDGLNNFYCMNEAIDVTIYTDNETIQEDNYFQNIKKIKSTSWYEELVHSDREMILYVTPKSKEGEQTKVSLIRKLFVEDPKIEVVLKIDLNGNQIQGMLEKERADRGIYLYEGEELLYAKTEKGEREEYKSTTILKEGQAVHKNINLLNDQWTIVIMTSKNTVWGIIYEYRYGILCLLLFTLICPTILIRYVSKSILSRIALLEKSFDTLEENMVPISKECGRDEIGMLVKHFNLMVNKINDLIHRNQKESERLRILELSKKQAELNALLSQADPHFMYNTLECISMRALLKGEKETANIILKLSLLLREMSSWRKDEIPIKEELSFVEAYLEIQKYRFGDKISYEILMEPGCEENLIPKLTVVTFVENACVHGIEEALDSGKITVKIGSLDEGWYVSVEDTGCGMSTEKYEELIKRIVNSDITYLYQSDNTGILNSYIRLKMYFEEQLEFSIRSREEEGTSIVIKICKEGKENRCIGCCL